MKKFITLLVFMFSMGSIQAQVGKVTPNSSTQGAITGGAAVTTNSSVIAPPSVSMLDMNRFQGTYSNGNVGTSGDYITIVTSTPSVMDFEGVIVSASVQAIKLVGTDKTLNMNRVLEIVAEPDNNNTPKGLYRIEDTQTGDVWILYEDPLNPKN